MVIRDHCCSTLSCAVLSSLERLNRKTNVVNTPKITSTLIEKLLSASRASHSEELEVM